MFTFVFGILILVLGYVFYSKYVENQFCVTEEKTPAFLKSDAVDYVPMNDNKNMLVHLLNIAGLGPILGAIQGILFGPVAFILIPVGCIFMGCVHDYFAGMLSVKNGGAQITGLIKQYLGNNYYKFFIVVVSILLILLTSVFIYSSGDILLESIFNQTDFSLKNPMVIIIYCTIALYYIIASLFSIDKIIGRFYPVFAILLLLGTAFIFAGFFINGINIENISFNNINEHPLKLHLLPMFFLTVSCGLLSGFHSTQCTIVSRTLKTQKEGKRVFYGMMCIESLIAMIWAAAAMHVYNTGIIPQELVGSVHVINSIADVFVFPLFTFLVTIAVVILPITSGDTALRGLRMIIADAFNLEQSKIKNRLVILMPILLLIISIILWAKLNSNSFALIWQYFNFVNQLIAIPTFLYATIYLYNNKKNYLITLIPGLFYVFVNTLFILNADIALRINYLVSVAISIVFTIAFAVYFYKKKLKNDGIEE